MDPNLEDSLTMESIENMDLDHAGVVINQEDITLENSGQPDDIPMDLDTIQEQHTLLEAGNEEVIVSDFMSDQFGFQEYSMQGENSSGANITIEANQLGELTTQNEQVVDLQYADCVSKPTTSQSSVITIKAVPQRGGKKAAPFATYPRQVAIAPKPLKGASGVQYAIAPKPVALIYNKNAGNISKGAPVKNVVQGLKGNTVLAQIGKQLVMMPAGSAGQKIKLSSLLPGAGGSSDSNIQFVRCSSDAAQLIANKGSKPVRTKFIVQGQSNADPSNQPAVITKLMPVSSGQARYVMQQKTVPISIGGNKVVLTTPPKQGAKVAPKKQIISIKAQSPKVVTSQGNVQTKKVVISANPNQAQNIILKAPGSKPSAQVVRDNTMQGQRTQLHPINVPGKGIQFIKLVTNQPTVQKAAPKPQTLAMSGKNFVLTDSKGNIIQMTAEKVVSSQPPPLLVSAAATTTTKVTTKAKKLVRIAPISHTGETPSAPKASRASQSLLMPREAKSVLSGTSVSLEEFNEMVDQSNLNNFGTVAGDEVEETDGAVLEEESSGAEERVEAVDIKPTLAALISDAVAGEESFHEITNMEEVEIEYESTPRKQEQYVDENTMEHNESSDRPDESLIIVPANMSHDNSRQHGEDIYEGDTTTSMDEGKRMQTVVSVEADVMPYLSQMDQNFPETVFMFDGKTDTPGLCARKPCNCTKSQCLKLYCDCFANGEFCNNCNCGNCHNNLENEELRQKAIRACLERNPNAFRPKIGKAKSGGPDLRRHNKGCNCKRSGCLKNYCECYEAKIPCTLMCKCVGCRNIEETLERRRDAVRLRDKLTDPSYRPPLPLGQMKQPCSFMTPEVIEAVAQCMLATVTEGGEDPDRSGQPDPVEDILLEFSRCMADIISASHQAL